MLEESPLSNYKHKLSQLTEKVQHAEKDALELDDIFVYPDIKELGEKQKIFNSGELVTKPINSFIIGSEFSGKSTLCNKMTLEFLDKSFGVMKIEGSDINDSNAESLFLKLKKRKKFFHEPTFNEKKVLIIDNTHNIKLNDRFIDKFFSESINFFDHVYCFFPEKEFITNTVFNSNEDFSMFKIQNLGYKKRDELYEKWLKVGNSNIETLPNNEFIQKLEELSNKFEAVMRNNVVDSKPFFILTVLQIEESFTGRDYSLTSLGECYSVLLHSLLGKQIQYIDYDSVVNFISFLSFKLLENDKTYFIDSEFTEWMIQYQKDYIIHPNIKEILINSHIIYLEDFTNYRFNQQYIFYYCAGKYLSDNYSNMSNIIADLCTNLNNEKKANILIFLVHHSRDTDLIDSIILYSTEFLNSLVEFDIFKHSEFLQKFLESYNHKITPNSPSKNRQKILHTKDIVSEKKKDLTEMEKFATDNIEEYISEDTEINKYLKNLNEANSAIRCIEVIGQVIKNRFGSLPTEQMEFALEQCGSLGFKSLSCYIDTMILTESEIRKLLASIISENENLTIKEAEDKAKNLVRQMAFNLSYFIIHLVSKSVSQKQVEHLLKKVYDNKNKPSYKLIYLGIQLKLKPNSLPKDLILTMQKDYNNLFFNKLLNHMIYNHMYLYEFEYSDLRWIKNTLNIEFEKAHYSKKTKIISTKNKQLLTMEDFQIN